MATGFVTFAVGLSAVAVTTRFSKPQSESVFLVEAVYGFETGIPRFMPTGRGCGGRYTQGYVTDDEQRVAEGVTSYTSRKGIRREFKNLSAKQDK